MDCLNMYSEKSTCCGGQESSVMQTTSALTFKDRLGSWQARWGINRMNYQVNPGLYRIGEPGHDSPVLVTANYKMSFDRLRKELTGINAWILVLDTNGINVWCAAGKGTFGTEELVQRIFSVNLAQYVSHKVLILPQLGAVGVAAHDVQKLTGFKVVYGPVRAADIPEFLANSMKATTQMRKVTFNLLDRLVLTPMEIVNVIKPALIVFGVMFLLNIVGLGRFDKAEVVAFLGALLVGGVFVPILLPWIPGRAFAFKGWLVGILWIAALTYGMGYMDEPGHLLTLLSYLLIFPAVSAFIAMNFTGASTYTSFSGVIKEMQIAVPAMLIAVGLGAVLTIVNFFAKF